MERGIEERAREAVLSDLARLFEDVDIFLGELRVGILRVVLVDELGEAEGAGQTGGTATDDDDVGLHLGAVDAFEGFAENQHFGGR